MAADPSKIIRQALMAAKSIGQNTNFKSAIGNNGDFDPTKPEIHKEGGGEVDDLPSLSFDPKEGSGAVPNNADVDYLGMVKHMPVSEFLSMAHPLDNPDQESIDYHKKMLRSGKSLGNPFLDVDWNEDKKHWKVVGHEGRHRATAIHQLYGPDAMVPVHIFPKRGMRARHITDEMKNAPFVSEQHKNTGGEVDRNDVSLMRNLINKETSNLHAIAKKHGLSLSQIDNKGHYWKLDDNSDANEWGEWEKLRWMKNHPQPEDGGFNEHTGQRSGESGIDVHFDQDGKLNVNSATTWPKFGEFAKDLHAAYHGKDVMDVLRAKPEIHKEGGGEVEDYRGGHTAPGPDSGAPIHKNTGSAKAIRLNGIGRKQFGNGPDPLADYVPERATHQYALHPDRWQNTFGSLTGKDARKLRYYKPEHVDIPEGTLVADMAHANQFYWAKSPEEKKLHAEAYKQSVKPLKDVDIKQYRFPELLIPKKSAGGFLEPHAQHVPTSGVTGYEDGGSVDMGINVRNDDVPYADHIVDGKKKYETRDSHSLKPYVGKRVAIVRTGQGPAAAIGEVTVGEPHIVDENGFRALQDQHLVPPGSQFDIKPGGQKYLYPMINPERYSKERSVGHGIVSRKVNKATGSVIGYEDGGSVETGINVRNDDVPLDHITDLMNRADSSIPEESEKIISEFVGHPKNKIRHLEETGNYNPSFEFGLMNEKPLERALSNPDHPDSIELHQAFEPYRKELRNRYGNTIPLYRYQRELKDDEGKREALSYTANKKFAEYHAEVPRSLPNFDEETIRNLENQYEKTGRADFPKTKYSLRNEKVRIAGKDLSIPMIYRGEEHQTDADSVRGFANQLNQDHEENEKNRAKILSKIVRRDIPVDDIVWGTNRAGQHEFIVRNRGSHKLGKMEGGAIIARATGGVVDPQKAIKRAMMVARSLKSGGGQDELPTGDKHENQKVTARSGGNGPQTGVLQNAGGVRGSESVLPAQSPASSRPALHGLPTQIEIPLTGGSITAAPDHRARAVAEKYMADNGLHYSPPEHFVPVDEKRAKRIASAYEAMEHNPEHPLTKAAYEALVKETMAQYQAAKNAGFKAEFWDPTKEKDPYEASPRLAVEDVRNNHHMYVFPTRVGFGSDPFSAEELKNNPLLAESGETWNGQPATVNDIFRAVHDYFGHAKEGVGFRANGEENAWRQHAAMFSPLARLALTSETRGQNSWLNFGPHGEKNRKARTEDTNFADQKVGILPPWAQYEGAEDFTHPHTVKAIYDEYNKIRKADGGEIIKSKNTDEVKDPDLFDMSSLHEVPKVSQFDLPRYLPPRGVPSRIQDVTKNKSVLNKMLGVVQRGREMGGERWYNAEPLRRAFVDYHGETNGNQAFRKYMDMVAATSPRSDVGTNVRNASYYFQRKMSGQGVPVVGDKNPQPYGHLAQRLHQMNAQRVAGTGWDPLNNPKPASFVENLTGNQRPATIDTHAFRLPGILSKDPRFLVTNYQSSQESPKQNIKQMVESGEMSIKDALKTPAYWDAAPKETEYGAMERYYQDKIAKELGISPAAAQASAWVGGGELTGLGSDETKPFMGFFQDRIYKTAREKNMDPKDVLKQFIAGKMSLYSSGGKVNNVVNKALAIAKKTGSK